MVDVGKDRDVQRLKKPVRGETAAEGEREKRISGEKERKGGGLMITFTLGIATPWAVCRFYDWKTRHSVINGRRLKFVGSAGSYFKLFIKCLLLSIVTLGVYGIWLYMAQEKWVTENTVFED